MGVSLPLTLTEDEFAVEKPALQLFGYTITTP